ncbi:hypothetical protein BJ138DRAFT_1183298 [Hygrophoropsis aurantiaca]|uniref:Uncharacterized protein n=1 Tax=Hygrophoropsis aurantiaca TaxID=72124 RepID=A0ACB7ZZ06_9AGAM|nr:hypothetical protein BJ138DRAFT_1183298 [Hygrophoropsis aurantiaca]
MGKSKARRSKISSKAKGKARALPEDTESDSDISLLGIVFTTSHRNLDSDLAHYPALPASAHAVTPSTQRAMIQTSLTSQLAADRAANQLRRLTEFVHELRSLQEGFPGKFSASVQLMIDMGDLKRGWLLANPRLPLSEEAEEWIMDRYWDENARLKEMADLTCETQLTPSEGGKPRCFYMVGPLREGGGGPQTFAVKNLEGFRYKLAKDELLKDNTTVVVGEKREPGDIS